MTDRLQVLNDNEKTKLRTAMLQRDSAFLNTCLDVLGVDKNKRQTLFPRLYNKLAKREYTKLDALDEILIQSDRSALIAECPVLFTYDLEYLLDFAPQDNVRFVSMLIDFFADRSPTPDEVLQFSQMLQSEKISRMELLETMAERFFHAAKIDNGQIISLGDTCDVHTVCQRWRGRLMCRPEAVVAKGIEASGDDVIVDQSSILYCEVDLSERRNWRLHYCIEQSTASLLKIELRTMAGGKPIMEVSSSDTLSGSQAFSHTDGMGKVAIAVLCPDASVKKPVRVTPVHIKFEPIK